MLGRRLRNPGLLLDGAGRPNLVRAHLQILQRLCQDLSAPARRVCVVCSAAAREGRSTLATNLAYLAAREMREPVLLIDADTQSPTLHHPLGLTQEPGLSAALSHPSTLADLVQTTRFERLSLLAAGGDPLGGVALAEARPIIALLEEAAQRFAWVFVDTAPLTDVPAVAAFARRGAGVLLAVRSGVTRVQLLRQAVAKLDGASAQILGIVLTQRRFAIPQYVYRRL